MGSANFTYGTTLDGQIARRVRLGQVLNKIAREMGVSAYFVRTRVYAIGLQDVMRANAAAFKSRPRKGISCDQTKRAVLAHAAPPPGDPVPAVLTRRLRGRSVPFTRNAIGCLHQRGLTVDELHSITGKPVPFIVDAIQRASSCL